MNQSNEMSTYSPAHQIYYMENAEKISEKEKKEKRWLAYYEKNKEACKERALARYYKKIGKERPPKKEKVVVPPGLTVAGVNELMAQLKAILPAVRKEEKKGKKVNTISPILSTV